MVTKALVGAPIGANMDAVVAGTANAAGTYVTGLGAPAQLGTVINGIDGTRYMLVQADSASGAMASAKAPNAYAIGSDFRAALMTSTRALAGLPLGFGPAAVVANNSYFWARVAGTGFTARVAASASAAKFLRTTTTKGRLGTASTASAVTFQAVITAIASASTSAGNTVRTVWAGQLAAIGVNVAI